MADQVRRRRRYDPYRNVSYSYDGSAVRVSDPVEAPRPAPRPRKSARRQAEYQTRPQVEVRPAGKVAPFAVGGFLCVAVMAVLILLSFVELSTISQDMVALDGRITELRSEEASLRARYELAYDLGAIEKNVTADGSMARPQEGQMVYVSLAEPDRVIRHAPQENEPTSPLAALREMGDRILSYF